MLAALGIGKPGQRILDLGTGTGVLARAFARRGAVVTGVDIAANQIAAAQSLAAREGLDIALQVSPVEAVDFPDASFDVISAGQSWLYFDASAMIPKVLRLMTAEGCLVLTSLLWLPHKDRIARQSEELVLKYNPDWGGAGYSGTMPPVAAWARESFDLRTFHVMEAPLPFTREAWQGRFRACRGIGASLGAEDVETFDAEHGIGRIGLEPRIHVVEDGVVEADLICVPRDLGPHEGGQDASHEVAGEASCQIAICPS